MNSGEEVFYSQTRLSTPGRPQLSSFILVLTDSATPRGSNVSLFSEVNRQPLPTDVTSRHGFINKLKGISGKHIPSLRALLLLANHRGDAC